MKNLLYFFLVTLLPLSFISCNDDPVQSIVTIPTTEGSGAEDAGIVTVNLTLNAPLEGESQIEYSFGGTAALNGDYKVISANPIVLPAGATSASIEIEIIDDEVIESIVIRNGVVEEVPEKQIIIELVSASGNAVISSAVEEKTFTYALTDNDDVPDTGMKIDLLWSVQGTQDIDQVDLNLYALYDVVISNNTITDFKVYSDTGEKTGGFESLVIEDSAPDSEYFVLIEYFDGTGDAEFTFMGYASSGISYGDDTFAEPTDDNNMKVYGPVTTKSGTNFSRISNVDLIKSKLRIQNFR
ncbi:MAG: hypothetical protein ACNS60_13715 [Candidatus Cyclobacteriaceae bacterium M2_1C_046]